MFSVRCWVGYLAEAPILAQSVLSFPFTSTAHIPVPVSSVFANTPQIYTYSSSLTRVYPASSLLIQPTKATLPPFFYRSTWFAALTVFKDEPPGVVVLPAMWNTSLWIPICSGVTREACPWARPYLLWRTLSLSSTVRSSRGFSMAKKARFLGMSVIC